jgi:hypothetical protein
VIRAFRGRYVGYAAEGNIVRFRGFRRKPAPTAGANRVQHYSVSLFKPYIQFRHLPHGTSEVPPVSVTPSGSGGTAVSRGKYRPAARKRRIVEQPKFELPPIVIPFTRPVNVVVSPPQVSVEEDDTELRLLLLLDP